MNRMLAGGVCGIFGFGGIGEATAKLMRAIGMRIHAINRRGATDAEVDWIGGVDRLDALLAASDVLLISAPLTRATRGIIDAAALARMKPDAILINLARGELIDEAALFAHLLAHPRFHRLHRCVVGRAGAARPVRDGPAVHDAAERDRLAAQFGVGH